MKIHVQLPSGYSTLKWALEFGITVKNGSCACIGRISGLHFCTSFTLRGQSVLHSSGAGECGGGWRGEDLSPTPMSPSPGSTCGSGTVPGSSSSRHSTSSALPVSGFPWVTPAARFHREDEERVQSYGEAGSWDRRDAETVMRRGSLSWS